MSSLLNVNGDVNVNMELSVPKGLDRMYRQMVSDVVRACGTRYGFDAELALKELNIIEGKDVKGKGEGKGKKDVKGVVKGKEKCVVTFPYSEVLCEGKCVGLRLNHGLYSQCMGELLVGGVVGVDLCECCVKQGVNNGRGVPDYGMWRDREGKFDGYVDSKGRSPVSYLKVMVRNGWTRDMVEAAALRNGVTVDVRHFAIVEGKKRGKKVSVKELKEVKSRGRPKKSDKVVERGDGVDELSDLFAQLQHEVEVEEEVEVEVEEAKVFEVEVPLKKKGETAEERVIRKNAEKSAKSISKSSKSSKSTSSSSSASVSSSMDVDAITRVSNIIASVAVSVAVPVPVVSVSSESVVPMVKESIKSVDVSSGSKLVDKKALKDASKLEEKMLKEASKLEEKALKEASKINVSKKVTKKVEDKVVVEKVEEKVVEKVVVEEFVSTTVFDSIAVSSRDTIEDEEDGELELEELELEDEDDEDDDDSLLSSNPEVDEAVVYPFNHKGVEYLHSISSGVIYDKDTHDAIGKLNKDTNTIDLFEEEEEDDEDEDEDEEDEDEIEDRC